MAEIKTLLFATDFSKGATRACGLARALAESCDAALTLLHVISELSDRQARLLPAQVYQQLATEVERQAVQDMTKFRDKHFSDMAVATDIVIGPAHTGIIDYGKKIEADLILMGTHGRAGLQKMLLGSVAEKVVRMSPIPVLTVRE